MCDQCAVLQDEVDYLRDRLGDRLNADLVRILMKTFGFTHGEAKVVAILHQRRGAVAAPWELEDAYDGGKDIARRENTMQVLIYRIRKKAGRGFLLTYLRAGYGISDNAMQAIDSTITVRNAS